MIHERHFTVEEANASLGWIVKRVEEIREARDRLAEPDAHEALAEAAPAEWRRRAARCRARPSATCAGLSSSSRRRASCSGTSTAAWSTSRRVIDGREVYLCWELGEDEVAHWHDLDSGFGAPAAGAERPGSGGVGCGAHREGLVRGERSGEIGVAWNALVQYDE